MRAPGGCRLHGWFSRVTLIGHAPAVFSFMGIPFFVVPSFGLVQPPVSPLCVDVPRGMAGPLLLSPRYNQTR